jgi:alpha-tubulin suppressor-like RCC1 family protein
MRRLTALFSAGLLAIGLLVAAPTIAEAKKPSPITVAPSTPQRGITFTVKGKMPTKVARPVQAQYKSGKKWLNLAAGTTKKSGAYAISVSTLATKLTIRVVAKKTKIKKKTYKKVVTKSKTISLTTPAAPTITTTTVPATTATLSYATAIGLAGGSAPFNWSATGLPAGLAINPSTGVIAGKATVSGTYTLTVSVTDAFARTSSMVMPLSVHPADKLISAGWIHSCIVTGPGVVKCWGSNESGRLGDGSGVAHSTPVQVAGLTSGFVAVAAGTSHTCALRGDGVVLCWGKNQAGQLGDGTTIDRAVPVAVFTNATSIDARGGVTCATNATGDAYCWGDNTNGQLGDGTTTERHSPVMVATSIKFSEITVGNDHVCGLSLSQAAYCWGDNSKGQLGDNGTADSTSPVAPKSLGANLASLTTGRSHTCAATASGDTQCWGNNGYGQVGDGTTASRIAPTAVSGPLANTTLLSAGEYHTCAVTTTGTAWCWGRNDSGQLGIGTTTGKSAPAKLGTLSDVVAISAGDTHTCALKNTGAAACWGANTFGQLGDGSTVGTPSPTVVHGLS